MGATLSYRPDPVKAPPARIFSVAEKAVDQSPAVPEITRR